MNVSSDTLAENRQIREALIERLSKAASLQDAGRIALELILETSGRSGGMIVIAVPKHAEPYLIISQGLRNSWAKQIQDPDSDLRRWAQNYVEQLANNRDKPAPDAGMEGRDLIAPGELAASIPIADEDSLYGALFLLGKSLSPAKLEQLDNFIPPICRALRTTRLLDNIHERARKLAGLQTELTRMGFHTNVEAIQAHMLQGACKVLEGETGALVLLDENNSEWMIRKTLREGDEWVYQINPRSGKGLVRTCLNSGEITQSDDPSNDPRFDPGSDSIGDLPIKSMICAPLIADGHVLGAIQIINKQSSQLSKDQPESFTAFDRNLISIIAALAANALQSAQLIQQLKVANADLEASRWELLGSRNTLRALFDNLPTALYIIDSGYTVMAINQSRAQIIGQSPKSLVGKTCYQALFDRSTPCPDCRVQDTFQEAICTQRKESRRLRNEETEWKINTYPISDDEGKVVQAILLEQDITEQQRLEGILAQSEKLAAIGQLAAGVAHEINNPLTAIIANAQILHRELPANSDLQESVDLIARAGARATQVVRNLLDFARKEEYHLGLTDLNETMQRSLDLMQHEILSRGVQIDYEPDPNLPAILASQDHLQSVWLNLLLNAVDALDKTPGEIKVSTRKVGDEIHVSIVDNGKGITPERLTRIFEPFYTTKEPGRGTGLGLSVCHRIIKQHGGHIRVESQVGFGSEFTVILPMS